MATTVVDRQTTIPRAKAACKRAAEAVLKDKKVVVALVDDRFEQNDLFGDAIGHAKPPLQALVTYCP